MSEEKTLLPKRWQRELKAEFEAKMLRSNCASFLYKLHIYYTLNGPPTWQGAIMAINENDSRLTLGWIVQDDEIEWADTGVWTP